MAGKSIRNIGFFGHAGCGKTTIADAFIYCTGANSRFGKVTEKTSFFDTDPEEIERICSLNIGLAILPFPDKPLL
jgi:elongation factor G